VVQIFLGKSVRPHVRRLDEVVINGEQLHRRL